MCLGFRLSANTRPNVIRKTPHNSPKTVDHIAASSPGRTETIDAPFAGLADVAAGVCSAVALRDPGTGPGRARCGRSGWAQKSVDAGILDDHDDIRETQSRRDAPRPGAGGIAITGRADQVRASTRRARVVEASPSCLIP